MKKIKFEPGLLAARFATLLLCACSASPLIKDYPVREIDRSYTLPKGLNRWSLMVPVSVSGVDTSLAVFPWSWEQSLTDDLTMVWWPLPVEFKYQLVKSERQVLGLRFNLLGESYIRSGDFNLSPVLEITSRTHFGPKFGLVAEGLLQPEVRRTEEAFHLTALVTTGPLFQITDRWAFTPLVTGALEFGNPNSRYLGTLPPDGDGSSHARFPFGFRTQVVLHEQWEAKATYSYLSLGFPEGYRSHQLFFVFTHLF